VVLDFEVHLAAKLVLDADIDDLAFLLWCSRTRCCFLVCHLLLLLRWVWPWLAAKTMMPMSSGLQAPE
jgi:hypothetical protein